MLTSKQEEQIKIKGITLLDLENQIKNFKNGFPYLKIIAPATPEKGIKVLDDAQETKYVEVANSYKGDITKFVPASGAATRMFKDLFEAAETLNKGEELNQSSPAQKFIDNITNFPFFNSKNILELTLFNKGLNYGSMPKGLIEFHKYKTENRTPFQEHLVEGALYAKDVNNNVKISFTVSKEHQDNFEALYNKVKKNYQEKYSCVYDVSFSNQLPSTDIVAVDSQNNLFKLEDDTLLFRPGGHGALLQNLNNIDSNIIVIKNIDNVVKESLLSYTIKWKKILIGKVISLQTKVFEYLNLLYSARITDENICEISGFLESEFCVDLSGVKSENLVNVLKEKLNRPIRVCGMVRNLGEPGGGPFIIRENDGTTSLQILEGAQINPDDDQAQVALKNSTHFNPVDIVCAVRNYRGEKFNLMDYVDNSTGFISEKSYKGKVLKAQELPGLWNGSMSNWNTQFVETPIVTFNPVKTVLDLLRDTHRG